MTQALVDKLRNERRRVEIWDTAIKNFYVQIRESGAATFYVRYTKPGTNTRKSLLIADAAIVSVISARVKAKELLSQAELGGDPGEVKQQKKECPTMAELIRDYYLPYIKATKKSWQTDEVMLRRHVLPAVGQKKLYAITANDLSQLQIGMVNNGFAPATANRPIVVLRYMFNLTINLWQIPGITTNPAKAVRMLEENNVRQVFLSQDEIQRLLEAGRACEQNPYLLSIVAFLVLTGVRRNNALHARWCEIDEAAGLWHIPMTKSGKPQTVHLPPEARTLLQTLPSRGQSPYLFPSPITGKPFVSVYYSWNSMRERAGLGHVRMHDLRHTFASLLINAGYNLFVVQKALGHHTSTVTMRYAHLADSTLQQAAQAVGQILHPALASTMKTPE
ncbi:tyrosine-type recombinase/integrase [Noviherbaspirillum sp. CPCC 100848]|uniref:Tyrosine-type recombinase/integrase n=1 Tax=Noviherbaspirillum album TaxID=3080276 RepID=A0ABU6JIT7_9BURK|nr:tyrosine-type recombinase/integrase [Noviherbaspirillum sp. CPCC 100848]MEC4723574.1 tyrosine-type recombinase/integrase [Noviherbaspirillum sp. CPCC 100848]